MAYAYLLPVMWTLGMIGDSYPETKPSSHHAPTPIADAYHQAADTIIKTTLAGNDAMDKMEELCIGIGHRLSGSPQLDQAIAWAIARMKSDGQENVHGEKVMVPHWVRGKESVTLMKPRMESLHMVGLGGSVGTPREGITAPVVVVADEHELEELGDAARGKIVLFNNPMPAYDPEHGAGYGKTVRFRSNGAAMAAKQGAVAMLIRSVTANSLRSPHTGAMRYDEEVTKIPGAALSTEDANTLAIMQKRGLPIVVNLKMQAKTLPDAESANVIGELRGTTWPNEVVVIGGHIDSWDVGQGANDDGGGCVIAMEAINVLRKLNMAPKRTIRVVLWTNEENGLHGARAYAERHADDLANHVAAIESDSGIFAPRGYSVDCSDEDREELAMEQLRDLLTLVESLGAKELTTGHTGADVSPMRPAGVVLMGHNVEGSTYFNYHHTHADTLD